MDGLTRSELEGLRQAMIDVPGPAGVATERPLSELDSIVIQQTTLHGKFSTTGDASPPAG